MALFQGLLFLVFGIGLLVVDYRSLEKGWLPCGNGIRGRLKFWREEQPFAYWLMFVVYGVGGLWLAIFALRVLVGSAEPLPL